jgi:hypothetical protein
MIGSDIEWVSTARRAFVAHCSVLVAVSAVLVAPTVRAQGSQAAAPAVATRTLLVVGDSLSAEYGLARGC